jgi:hypothetical protein
MDHGFLGDGVREEADAISISLTKRPPLFPRSGAFNHGGMLMERSDALPSRSIVRSSRGGGNIPHMRHIFSKVVSKLNG